MHGKTMIKRLTFIQTYKKDMKIRLILIAAAVSLTLTGCGTFKKYEPQVTAPADIDLARAHRQRARS